MDEDMKFLLGRLDGKLDSLVASFNEHKSGQTKVVEAHDKRITALEKFRWLLLGGAAVAGPGIERLLKFLIG